MRADGQSRQPAPGWRSRVLAAMSAATLLAALGFAAAEAVLSRLALRGASPSYAPDWTGWSLVAEIGTFTEPHVFQALCAVCALAAASIAWRGRPSPAPSTDPPIGGIAGYVLLFLVLLEPAFWLWICLKDGASLAPFFVDGEVDLFENCRKDAFSVAVRVVPELSRIVLPALTGAAVFAAGMTAGDLPAFGTGESPVPRDRARRVLTGLCAVPALLVVLVFFVRAHAVAVHPIPVPPWIALLGLAPALFVPLGFLFAIRGLLRTPEATAGRRVPRRTWMAPVRFGLAWLALCIVSHLAFWLVSRRLSLGWVGFWWPAVLPVPLGAWLCERLSHAPSAEFAESPSGGAGAEPPSVGLSPPP